MNMQLTTNSTGEEIRQAMEEVGGSPALVCATADISYASLYKILRDEPTIKPRTKRRVVEALIRLRGAKASA